MQSENSFINNSTIVPDKVKMEYGKLDKFTIIMDKKSNPRTYLLVRIINIVSSEGDSMKKGDLILFKGQAYNVVYIYESGFLEIKRRQHVELIHRSEVELITRVS